MFVGKTQVVDSDPVTCHNYLNYEHFFLVSNTREFSLDPTHTVLDKPH